MNIARRQLLKFAGGGILTPLVSRITGAAVWPAKPIRAIVPLAAGTVVDIVARLVLKEVETALGQPIVIDNRPGAAGTVGTAFVAKADPDGYTMLINSSTHTIVPSLYSGLSYDVARDFAAVIPLAGITQVLMIAPSKGIKSLNDLVSAAKAKPGSLSYGSSGVGTTNHLAAERLRVSAGFDALHVPYRGGGGLSPDLLTGRIDFAYVLIGNNLEFLRDGRLIALAVSSWKRTAILPDVPTTLEAGFADCEFNSYLGMFVPARTPRDIVNRLHQETATVLATPSMQEKLGKFGAEPMVMEQAEFDAMIARDFATNAALVKSIGLSLN